MAANNVIASEECCDSDFENDFVPTRVLKTIEVGIDEVSSIAMSDIAPGYCEPETFVSVFGSYLPGVFNQSNGAPCAVESTFLLGDITICDARPNAINNNNLFYVIRNGYASNKLFYMSVNVKKLEGNKQQISLNYTPDQVCIFEPDVIVSSVCNMKNGQIAVCAVINQPYKQTDNRRGLVRICRGNETFISQGSGFKDNAPKDIEFDGETRLFTYPRRIAESGDGNLWVVNRLNERTGNITVIGIDGKLRFRYNRNTDNSMFDPMDVAANINGSMIIADFRNHLVHLVKVDGSFLQYIMTHEHGLEFPSALALDRFERAWVGCDFGKLHIVRFNKRFK